MKRLIILLLSICIWTFAALSQNMQDEIQLRNGKTITDIRLHMIGEHKIVYEEDGSLHDLSIRSIEKISTPTDIITFDKDNQPVYQKKKGQEITSKKDSIVSPPPPDLRLDCYAAHTPGGSFIVKGITFGTLAGIAGGTMGGLIGYYSLGSLSPYLGMLTGTVGAATGYIIGTATTVYVVGKKYDPDINWGTALAGTSIGIVGSATMLAITGGHAAGFVLAALLPSVGATLTIYTAMHKHKKQALQVSLKGKGLALSYQF